MDNKTLEIENISSFFVVIADRDGCRKYISESFPRLYQYTIKIGKAKRFNTEDQARHFIDEYNDYGKYVIENAEIKKVYRQYKLA